MRSSFRLDMRERSQKEEKDGRNESERDTGRDRVRIGSEKERVREREREKEREKEREREREKDREREKRRSEDISDALSVLNMSSSTIYNTHTHTQQTADIASPNARLTLTMLERLVCGGDVSLSSVDCIVAAALADFREIVDFQDSVREHYINASTKTKKPKKIPNNGNSSGKRNEMDSSEHSAKTEGPPPLPQDHYDRTDSPKTVRTIIGILVICSRLYKKSGEAKKRNENFFHLLIFHFSEDYYFVLSTNLLILFHTTITIYYIMLI